VGARGRGGGVGTQATGEPRVQCSLRSPVRRVSARWAPFLGGSRLAWAPRVGEILRVRFLAVARAVTTTGTGDLTLSA